MSKRRFSNKLEYLGFILVSLVMIFTGVYMKVNNYIYITSPSHFERKYGFTEGIHISGNFVLVPGIVLLVVILVVYLLNRK